MVCCIEILGGISHGFVDRSVENYIVGGSDCVHVTNRHGN